MPDLGDSVQLSLTVAPADGTTAATLTIYRPDGTTSTPTTTSADGGTTWTAGTLQLTQASIWALIWTVTGTGAGVEPQRIIVIPAATPGAPPALPTLADITNLVGVLGRDLTAAEAARAPSLLAGASARLRGFCRRDFATVTDAVFVTRPVGAILRLPNPPTAVTQVAQMGADGTVGRVLTASTDWAWAGLNEIELWPNSVPPLCSDLPDRYQVTYSYDDVPEFIQEKCVEVVLRTLMAPTLAAGLVSERAGQYFYQYGQMSGGQSPGPTAKLTTEDKTELREAGYRPSAATIVTRAA